MSVIEQALEKARRAARTENPPAAPREEARPAAMAAPVEPADPVKAASRAETAPLAETPRPAPPEQDAAVPLRRPEDARAASEKIVPYLGEEYRLLKEKLLALRRGESAMNMFMVTSPVRNEGKTHVTCNLALSLAHEFDHTVLLVDADMRAPSCHRVLGIPRPAGISDCLLDGKNFWEVLVHTGIGRLSFLSAGRPVPYTAELFSSNLMSELLHEIKTRYADRLIIIDTPPFLPFAETRLLGRLVDGVLLVARENVTLKSHLVSAVKALEGSNLLGLVYNDAVNCGADKEIFNLGYTY